VTASTPSQPSPPVRFHILTLGCPKNEADSDRLERALRAAGLTPGGAGDADLLVVNTCGFIDAAKEESIDAILDAAATAHARGARVAAVGCLVERYRRELEAELPEVDLWCGLDRAALLAELSAAPSRVAQERRAMPPDCRTSRRPRPVHAYIKVSDGCDRHCAFCAIPLIKGRYASLSPQAILADARAALDAGAQELVLVGQDTSHWAWPGWGGLQRLLGELRALGPTWLRLLYLQPEGVDDGLLEALALHAVPYVDLPLQHASGSVLRRMGRSGEAEAYLALLAKVRRAVPGAAVRSTFIAGFPGETEDDVDTLLDFIASAELAVAGVFAFDPQEGTRAATLPGQVPLEVRLERAARVSTAIDAAAASFWIGLAGRDLDVLVERGTGSPDGEAVGRLAVQAPDIDGRTLLSGRAVRRGRLARARVVGVLGYDVAATTTG
jgi:ribosomal protein S12 methylthiotransferase